MTKFVAKLTMITIVTGLLGTAGMPGTSEAQFDSERAARRIVKSALRLKDSAQRRVFHNAVDAMVNGEVGEFDMVGTTAGELSTLSEVQLRGLQGVLDGLRDGMPGTISVAGVNSACACQCVSLGGIVGDVWSCVPDSCPQQGESCSE